jgi:hypothetical protein
MKAFFSAVTVVRVATVLATWSVMASSKDSSCAAPILWSETIVDTTDGDSSPGGGLGDLAVSTNGTLVEAANLGTLADYSVNGVLFNGVDFDSSTLTNFSIAYDSADNLDDGSITGTSTGGSIDGLSTSFARDMGVSFHRATITGLTIGQNYEVQFLSSFSNLGRTTIFDDGQGRTTVQRTNNPHSLSTGRFTADAITQSIELTISTGSQFLNAYQLRAVNDPPIFPPQLTIDRDTGSITLSAAVDTGILGYSITSESGALDQSGWTPITENYDLASGPGDGSVDADDAWTVLSGGASDRDLSEAQFGGAGPQNGGTISSSSPIVLSSGGAWRQFHKEDVEMKILHPDGSTEELFVEFVGNGGVPFDKGDFDFDGDIDGDDHAMFAAGLHADLGSLSIIEAYIRGDLNEDRVNNVEDFLLFQVIYDEVNGPGALAALLGTAVPEPSTIWLLLTATALTSSRNDRIQRTAMKALRWRRLLSLIAVGLVAIAGWVAGESASAANITWSEIIVDSSDGDSSAGTGLGDLAVSTRGSLIEAANFGTLDDVTVNGVLFNGVDFDSSTLTHLMVPYDSTDNVAAFGNGGTTTGGNIDLLTGSFGRDAGVSNQTATLTGLTLGENYEVQFIASFANLNRTTTFADGNGNSIVQRTNNPHSFTTGLFTADAATQTIEMTISSGSQFISGYQLRQLDDNPLFLDLLVDPVNGLMKIRNQTGESVNLNYYEITSATDSLDAGGWISLDDQNIGFGPAAGESWTEAGGSDEGILSEFFTLGSTMLADQAELSLGKAFGVGNPPELNFNYLEPGSTALTSGTVTVGTIVAGPGDADGDGDVDGADFLLLQRTNPTQISQWQANFGTGVSLAAASAVPEPATWVMIIATGMVAMLLGRRNRSANYAFVPASFRVEETRVKVPAKTVQIAVLMFCWAISGGHVSAAVTNDREYWFGEDSLEGASQGQIIGGANSGPLASGDSADSKGPTGAFLDLTRSGNPTYERVDATGGLNRPGASNGDFGARFDGEGDVLHGFPLNRPDVLDGLVGGGYPLNYTGITGRGLQLWVYPGSAALGSTGLPTTFQSIVADTNRGGGPAINEFGQWTQISGNRIDGTNGAAAVPASVDVTAGDTWYHVMHHNYPRGGDSFLTVLYVDGIALSANIATIRTTPDTGYVPKLAVGGAEVPNDGLSASYGLFFTGVVDDLQMYVFGDNSAQGGQDYGTFDLFSDNDWIADQITKTIPGGVLQRGDVNKDGAVNGDGTGPVGSDDVSAFVAGWLSENTVPAIGGTLAVGDWNTWDDGDMNHDGITDLDDAFILHQALKGAGFAGLDFTLLAAKVPEPASVALVAFSAIVAMAIRWRPAPDGAGQVKPG